MTRARRIALGDAAKRALDLVLSFVALALLLLPLLVLGLAIRLDSRGPSIFRQRRIGRNGRAFDVYKLRTMVVGAVEKGRGYGVQEGDARITRVGRVLRDWGLDELPQLLNVLRGDMSVVGPRPALAYQVEQYDEIQKRRLEVRPGITGWALVNGRRTLSWEQRIALDVWYVDHRSFLLDLRIMLKTLKVVLITREGLYASDPVGTFGSGWDEQRGEGESE